MRKLVLKNASNYCEQNKHRLTGPRTQVLEIIASSSKPLGAYEILEKLSKTLENPKPPTVYRAIEFWQKHGFVHRIESLNAYVTCGAGHQHKGSQFMICNDCGQVEEIHQCHLPQDFGQKIKENGFKIDYWNTEITGQCKHCQ